jgi:hypothetical protein
MAEQFFDFANGKFKLDYGAVSAFLKGDAGGIAATLAAAQQVLAQTGDAEAKLTTYTTDRYVNAVLVPSDKQAKHGTGSRAAGRVAAGARKPRGGRHREPDELAAIRREIIKARAAKAAAHG